MPFGTFSILDTLAASNQTIAQFGLDRAFDHIRLALDAHNQIMRDIRTALMDVTTDRLRRGGSYAAMVMQELDEFGTPDAQKITAGANVGIPLRRFGGGLQWSGLALKRMQAREMAAEVQGMMDADIVNFTSKMKQAIYFPTNYNFDDRLVDKLNAIQLPVKALQNADGFPIPPGPNAETFNASTHTHYLVAASTGTLAAADVDALILTVREHFAIGQGYLGINFADSAAVAAMTKFKALIDSRIIQPTTGSYVDPSRYTLDVNNTNNRMIGIYDGVEVWVKPWVPSGYPTCWWLTPSIGKPLIYRYDPLLPSELQLTYKGEVHDLMAEVYERYFGVSVWNRIAMAVLDVAHGTYTAPSV